MATKKVTQKKKVVNKVKTDHTVYDKVVIRKGLVQWHRDYDVQTLEHDCEMYEWNENYQQNFRVLCDDFFPLFFNFCADEHSINPIKSCERAKEVMFGASDEMLYYNEGFERPKIQDLTLDEISFAAGFFMRSILQDYCNWTEKRTDFYYDNLSKFK